MQFAFFTINSITPEQDQQMLNAFCAQHRIVSVEKQFIERGLDSFWSLCITYLVREAPQETKSFKRDRIDYREVLNAEDFAVYAELRTLRKTLSQQEGVPAYALFTNEQLAAMVTRRVETLTTMHEIDGIGTARLEKYGTAFLNQLQQARSLNNKSHAPTSDSIG